MLLWEWRTEVWVHNKSLHFKSLKTEQCLCYSGLGSVHSDRKMMQVCHHVAWFCWGGGPQPTVTSALRVSRWNSCKAFALHSSGSWLYKACSPQKHVCGLISKPSPSLQSSSAAPNTSCLQSSHATGTSPLSNPPHCLLKHPLWKPRLTLTPHSPL